jgi:hypothetical protein
MTTAFVVLDMLPAEVFKILGLREHFLEFCMLLSLSIVQSGRHVANIFLSTSATPCTSQDVH